MMHLVHNADRELAIQALKLPGAAAGHYGDRQLLAGRAPGSHMHQHEGAAFAVQCPRYAFYGYIRAMPVGLRSGRQHVHLAGCLQFAREYFDNREPAKADARLLVLCLWFKCYCKGPFGNLLRIHSSKLW